MQKIHKITGMQLRIIIKWGTLLSVLLFCLAMGYYAYMRLDMAEYSRKADLFSLVPSDCFGVLESHDVKGLFDSRPMLNYDNELERLEFPGLFQLVLEEVHRHSDESIHGLDHNLNEMLVSFHNPLDFNEQVVYLRTNGNDRSLLSDIIHEYTSESYPVKEDKYRGEKIEIYPLGGDEFLAAYWGKGFLVVSCQKRLVEKVIDARMDETALDNDRVFSQLKGRKKAKSFVTLYGRFTSIPFLGISTDCWSEYGVYLNSDVFYLTGDTYMSDSLSCLETAKCNIRKIPLTKEDSVIISADKDSTVLLTDWAYEANETGNRTLFHECVANLSHESDFTLVADMQKVGEEPERFQRFLPPFVLDNARLFRPFILSAQLSLNGGRFTQLWVFTYKN